MLTTSSGQRLTTTDALTYLKTVKEIFQDRRDKYDEFLEVMKDFKALRINTAVVILKVKELFKGNRDLILGFNSFLPKGFEITLPLENEIIHKKKPVEFEEAKSFVNKIKERFQGDDRVYKAFLDILNMYKKKIKSITDVYHEVSTLFEEHYDLLVEFTHFLPDVSGAASRYYPDPGRSSLLGDDRSYPTLARLVQVEKNAVFPDKEHLNNVEKSKEWEHADSSEHKRFVQRTEFMTDLSHQGVQDPEAAFRVKVKEGLQDPESYEKILDCIRSYKGKICPAAQFRKLVASLIGKRSELMVACEDFITHVEKTGGLRHNRPVYRSPKFNGDGGDHDREDKYENSDQDQKERHDRGVSFTTKDVHQKVPSYGGREKFMLKSIQDLDLSNCESCTPSYRLLPDNYPIPSASHRTEIGDEVLNDRWVSVTSGSEDYSFKHMRKNQYEESLFRCEDDRFELDMLLESVNATAKCVEELVDRMNASNNTESFFIEEHLTALNLRCIERLYGDHGLDVIDVLRKSAPLALPVILTRLKQKQEEWVRSRADFNKVWAEIYAKNYHKSLDHRSFYFKQQDTKNLSAKALLAEIKEMTEKNQNEEEMILFTGAGFKQPGRPQSEFAYSDPDIQEDLYQLINYACGEVCTPEQRDKVMIIWKLFLEPILGLPGRPPCREEKDATDKANFHSPRSLDCVGHEGEDHVAEVACSKTSDVAGNGAAQVPKEHGSSCRMHVVNYNTGASSAEIETFADKSNLLHNPHNNCKSKMMATKFSTLEESTVNTSREEGEASPVPSGPSADASDCQLEATPMRTTQDSNTTELNSCSIGMVPGESKVKEGLQENEACLESEREGGKPSPNKNLEVGSLTTVADTSGKENQTPFKNAQSSGQIGVDETDVADDEVEESVQGSSDSENASENADISASESANGEERSPNDPDDEVEHDENDNKAESEDQADSINDVHETDGTMLSSGQFLRAVKPLILDIPKGLHCGEKKSWIFYGNDSFYLLFRLHQMLYGRMQSAKVHSLTHGNKWKILNDTPPADPYARFKDTLHSLLSGSSDSAKFEDECRATIGAQSYILFTLDKLIYKLIKQMQTIGTEDTDTKLLQLYKYETSRSSETFSDAVYHENARFIIPDDNLYRLEYFPGEKRMTIQLMKNDLDKLEPSAVSMDPSFASYLNNELLSVVPNRKERPGIYLKRLKRKLYPGDDNSAASKYMEGIVIVNGLEMKINCNKKKASFVLDTTDVLQRIGKRKKRRICTPDAPPPQPNVLTNQVALNTH